MDYIKTKYHSEDFIKIRDFLMETFDIESKGGNWTIERWNFCRYVAQVFHRSFEDWPNTVGLWKDHNNSIVAVVNSQGEVLDRTIGEAFFQLKKESYSIELLNNMIEFAEKNLSINDGNLNRLNCFASSENYILQNELKKRGYIKTDSREYTSVIDIHKEMPIKLESQYKLVNATEFSVSQKAKAHGKAFGYQTNDDEVDSDALQAFSSLINAPDYNPLLDLAILNQDNEIVSFACFWYDEKNQIGMLEPLGTLPEYRQKGLAKLLVHQGINLIKQLGGKRLEVGSNQKFYKLIGFNEFSYNEVWFKEW